MSIETRFWAKVEKTESCWLWKGFIYHHGYGQFSIGRKHIYAHRAAYEMFRGEIPKGLTVDHLCRVRHCVNPAHMELVTLRVNLMRSNSISTQNAKVTHCPQGHAYAGENLHVRSNGNRVCRQCGRERANAKNRRFREANPLKSRLKPMCSKGHPLTPENLYVFKTTPERKCRICHLNRMKKYAEKARYR